MVSSGYENRKTRVELIPLIDVVFLLLVFFIYSMLSMVIHRGVKVELPAATTAVIDRNEYIDITITKDNSIFVGKKQVKLSRLVERVMAERGRRPDVPVFINGDRRADLGVAIRVLDLLRTAGIREISFESVEETQ